MAFSAFFYCELMQYISRLLLFVTGDTVVSELRRKRCMPERLDCLRGESAFVIGMALDTGVVVKAFMKKNFAGIFFQNGSCDSFAADVTLFMTTEALN